MMNTINTTGLGFSALWAIHILSVIVFFVGIILLIHWALRTFDAARLKAWGIGLVVAGTIVCLLTIGVRGAPWTYDGFHSRRIGMLQESMMKGGSMSMVDMMDALADKEGDAFDASFIEMMIPHHEGAIAMARDALQNATHDEIKKLARDIIKSQQREIDMMRTWKTKWGY